MHNKYATFVLPIVAGLAIVGAGFSTWVFGNTDTSSTNGNLNGTVTITGIENSGPEVFLDLGYLDAGNENAFVKLTEDPTFTLKLDQGSTADAKNENVGVTFDWTNSNLGNGLYLRWMVAKNVMDGYENYDVQATYSFKATADSAISAYVNVPEFANGAATTFIDGPAPSDIVSVEGTDYYYTLVKLGSLGNGWTWKEGKKPANKGDYEAMISSLLGASLNQEDISASHSGQKSIFALEVSVATTYTLK